MELTWTPALNIGHDTIDQQHVELFGLFDEFIDGSARGEAKDTLIVLHDRLKEYAEVHFNEEEALMQQANYPKLAQHKRAHDTFRNRLAEIRQQINVQGPTLMALIETNKALVSWLVNHVKEVDQQFGQYLKDNSRYLQ
jgi:hemerythrin